MAELSDLKGSSHTGQVAIQAKKQVDWWKCHKFVKTNLPKKFFSDPSNSELGSKLDEYLNKTVGETLNVSVSFNLSQVLNDCDGNGTGVYTLFDLKQLYDVDDLINWKSDFNIENVIKELEATIEVIFFIWFNYENPRFERYND